MPGIVADWPAVLVDAPITYDCYRGEADCDARCESRKSPIWVSPWNVGYRCDPDLQISPELTYALAPDSR